MGSFICRQPNGLLCRFSTVVDTVTHYNMTDEEYIQMYIQKQITTARAEAEDVIKNHLKPFEWIDEYFVDNNMTEEEFEQIKAKMCEPKGENNPDCRSCDKWKTCENGEKGHANGTSIGYSIGECRDYVELKGE